MPTPPMTEACYYILLSLLEPRHGYGIMQNADSLSKGRVKLAAGTLYGALSGLVEKGLIRAVDGNSRGEGRQKNYEITALGREALAAELSRLRELVANGEALIGKENENA